MVLFTLVFYATAFYPLVYRFSNKSGAETLLIRTKYNWLSYFVEPICGVTRNFIRAFLHAVLRNFYQTQILGLMISDIVFLSVTLPLKKYFLLGSIFNFTIGIYGYYFLLDLILTIHSRCP